MLIFLLNILYFGLIKSKENAVILILCRNSDMGGIISSIENFEKRFNNKFKYPYVFLNDQEFTEEFKKKLTDVCKNRVAFGKVDDEIWQMPKNIDINLAKKNWQEMKLKGVPYADVQSYHNMCRFFSRSFYKHPLLQSYDYYWRIEPDVSFHCDITEDPFILMRTKNIEYGFVILIKEFMDSIPSLFSNTIDFLSKNRNFIKPGNYFNFMFEDGKYNGCHFWSNFEIASFKFFRSEIYNKYVDYLESKNGFYYERWGDAPVHSLAVTLFLDKSKIHFFEEIGYSHSGITHCPRLGKNCDCQVSDSIDFNDLSCLTKYLNNS